MTVIIPEIGGSNGAGGGGGGGGGGGIPATGTIGVDEGISDTDLVVSGTFLLLVYFAGIVHFSNLFPNFLNKIVIKF